MSKDNEFEVLIIAMQQILITLDKRRGEKWKI